LGWAKDLRAHIERAFELLRDRRTDASYPLRASCDRLLALRPSIDALAQPPSTDGAGAFSRIRIHGDYHLGQTLKTHDGFVLIDFEGEPARPLAERRRLHCALKDVAGMCRSFDYAIATARRARADGADVLAATPALRDAFLAGYQRAAAGTAPHLPSSPEAREAWIRFFELDKALYEIEYELQNRPAWLRIPVEGALRLLDAGGVV
jgi:maltose alpha-D-glucosyltransferase/alpha-amylase